MDSPSITEQAERPYISTGHFVLFGPGQGFLVTLLFNVLVTTSPKEFAGDVGSLRGTTQNLAAAVGTALASALLIQPDAVGSKSRRTA